MERLQKPPQSELSIPSPCTQKTPILLEIDPHCCRPWHYHNRDQAWLSTGSCADLIQSIAKQGQIEPVTLRLLKGSEQSFEIITGVRRWFACSKLPGQKLLGRVIEADDRTCMVLMHAENAHSQDISDFERASSFAKQMNSGLFKNQGDLAKAMGVSQSTVSKMVQVAVLFENPWLVGLFDRTVDIPLRKAYRLSVLLKKAGCILKIETEARRILQEKAQSPLQLSAASILKRLIQCARAQSHTRKKPVDRRRILLTHDEKAMIVASEDQAGNLGLAFNRGIRNYDPNQIASLCVKAIHDYYRSMAEVQAS